MFILRIYFHVQRKRDLIMLLWCCSIEPGVEVEVTIVDV